MATIKLDNEKSSAADSCYKFFKYACFVMTLVILCVLALDAAELLSLGIVKGAMGMKVLSNEQYEEWQKVNTTVNEKLSSTYDLIKEQHERVSNCERERNWLQGQVNEKNEKVTQLTTERDALVSERDELKKQLEEAQVQTAEATKNFENLKDKRANDELANVVEKEEGLLGDRMLRLRGYK